MFLRKKTQQLLTVKDNDFIQSLQEVLLHYLKVKYLSGRTVVFKYTNLHLELLQLNIISFGASLTAQQ